MSKQLVATHDKVDPALVTAEDLVRAVRDYQTAPIWLAQSMGFEPQPNRDDFNELFFKAINYIAQRITLPEDEPLPFNDPIDGVVQ